MNKIIWGFVFLFLIAFSVFGLVVLKDKLSSHTNDSISNDAKIQKVSLKTSFSNVIDTYQNKCFNNNNEISCPTSGNDFFGQDAQYSSKQPSYRDNRDGTISDLNTGLIWQKNPGMKKNYNESVEDVKTFSLAGHNDWRVPTIKELYSLINFQGIDPSSYPGTDTTVLIPFIDPNYFDFAYGNLSNGERIIDSQWVTSNIYKSTVMNTQECFFGVNFADGRIKCYPFINPMGNGYFTIYVRGDYKNNSFVDNSDGTIVDKSFGLMWQKNDSGSGMVWEDALKYCENLDLSNYSDWRLPNIKELQHLVDYNRSPDTTDSAAINPIFNVSVINNEAGKKDYPYFWSSTTHIGYMGGGNAAYISFGRAMGFVNGNWIDVHGAGAQRSDPKIGNPSDYPQGHGPQGDAIRMYNYVRCVRGGANFVEVTNSGIINNPLQNNSGVNSTIDLPPQEAIVACSGKVDGSSCSIITPTGTVVGTCSMVQTAFACVPSGDNMNNTSLDNQSQNVNVTCTSFNYSVWTTCSNGQQTRTVVSSTPLGCIGGSPILSQSCTISSTTCNSFTYSGWSVCNSSGKQSKTILTRLPLNCVGGTPDILIQSCTPSVVKSPEELACSGKSSNAVCSFQGLTGTITGTCLTNSSTGSFACTPPVGKPEEVACSGKSSNSVCSFQTLEGTTITGKCNYPPGKTFLACMP